MTASALKAGRGDSLRKPRELLSKILLSTGGPQIKTKTNRYFENGFAFNRYCSDTNSISVCFYVKNLVNDKQPCPQIVAAAFHKERVLCKKDSGT